ncbi:SKI family transcriptional corepressor 2-like [Cygnus olor]|uniref:SKI family transcriptional corepressor 2-like n=1 Tax=Cygnus olor TaxID=8869 RepID=UPI001ADE529D|nr:SKI family transcriptional corepressor 2-like [Cygnus olor]
MGAPPAPRCRPLSQASLPGTHPPGPPPPPAAPQHAPRASLDAGGGRQPPGAGGRLRGGRPADGLHVAAQRGAVAGDLPGAGGGRLRPQRGPVPLQVEGAEAGFPLGAGDPPPCRAALAAPAPALPRHEEHLEGGRAARFRRAAAAGAGEAAPPGGAGRWPHARRPRRHRQLLQSPPQCCWHRHCSTQRTSRRAFQVDVGFSFTSSPNLLRSLAARRYAAAAFQPGGGCIAVVARGERVAGASPDPAAAPCTSCCIPPHPLPGCHGALKEESAELKAGFPGETSPGMGRGNRALPAATAVPGSPGTAAASEQAAGEEAADASLQGGGVAGLLQSVQQLLVQILQTSRQQQALLESLASDTVSHLHLLSHSLVQVGETLHQLLLRPQAPHGHYAPHIPLFEGGPQVPLLPGLPCDKEEPRVSPDAGCAPP